jgi:hypothetical protein
VIARNQRGVDGLHCGPAPWPRPAAPCRAVAASVPPSRRRQED